MVPLEYLSNFYRTSEMPLINCEISLILIWSKNCFLVAGTSGSQEPSQPYKTLCSSCNFINS